MHLVWLELLGVFKGVLYPDWSAACVLKRYLSVLSNIKMGNTKAFSDNLMPSRIICAKVNKTDRKTPALLT